MRNDKHIFNHIYCNQMTNSKPNIEEFKLYMKEIIDIEHYVARLQGKEEKWVENGQHFGRNGMLRVALKKSTTRTR